MPCVWERMVTMNLTWHQREEEAWAGILTQPGALSPMKRWHMLWPRISVLATAEVWGFAHTACSLWGSRASASYCQGHGWWRRLCLIFFRCCGKGKGEFLGCCSVVARFSHLDELKQVPWSLLSVGWKNTVLQGGTGNMWNNDTVFHRAWSGQGSCSSWYWVFWYSERLCERLRNSR